MNRAPDFRFRPVVLAHWLLIVFGLLLGQASIAAQPDRANQPVLHFAVLAFRPAPEVIKRWQPVADYLQEKMPGHRVILEPLDYPELDQAVRNRQIDLVLTQPAHYVALSVEQKLYSPLATLVESELGMTLTTFGGVIIARAGNTAVNNLSDLRGKRVATSHRESLGAFQAQAFELHELGIRLDPQQIIETGNQDGVITALREGKADVGFVRSGLLEQMAKEGKLALADFKVLKAAGTPDYPMLLSTRLYPQWALAAMPWLDETVARQIAGAVLSLPHDGEVARAARISGFNIPGDYRSVDRLMRTLRVPPFDARVPLQVIWEDHRPTVIVIGLAFLLAIGWGIVVSQRTRRQRRINLAALQESERRFFDFADAASDWFWEMGPDLRFTYFSERIAETLGASPAQLVGKTRRDIMDPADISKKWEVHLADLDQHRAFKDFEYHLALPDGSFRYISISGKPIFDARGEFLGYRGIGHDITTLKEQQRQLEHIAHYDSLTQLPNRVLLADRLQQAINQAERRSKEIAVVYLDLDGFKAVNDLYGHATGDKLLIEISNRMKQALREGDTLARLGGDEFVIVLLDLTDHTESAPILERLLQVAAWPVDIEGQALKVSASLGVTFFPQNEDVGADQLMRQADQAMYVAKQSGKNRYHIFDTDQDRAVRGRHESIERIREALENQEFILYYQPKVNMRSGEVVGAEALLRWQHPEQGIVPPGWFLPLVEDHELIKPIGDWVIEMALQQMEIWRAEGLNLPVSVNIAGRQLQAPEFLGKLKVSLFQHPDVAHQLTLEVLESSALEDIGQVSQLIKDCRELGVGFDLDDFGTGYSSLTYLKRLPAQTLKIDQSFVRDMLEDPDDLAILDGIIGLAASFQRDVIAEGIETTAHSRMLLRLGCELGQGYAIARPMPAADVTAWVAAWHPDADASAYAQIERDELPVLFAMTEHRAWIKELELYLRDRQPAPPSLDHHQCRFGQWLDRTGTRMYSGHPALRHILSLHEDIHRRANELMDMKVRGIGEDIWASFGELEIEALRDDLLKSLDNLLD